MTKLFFPPWLSQGLLYVPYLSEGTVGVWAFTRQGAMVGVELNYVLESTQLIIGVYKKGDNRILGVAIRVGHASKKAFFFFFLILFWG